MVSVQYLKCTMFEEIILFTMLSLTVTVYCKVIFCIFQVQHLNTVIQNIGNIKETKKSRVSKKDAKPEEGEKS